MKKSWAARQPLIVLGGVLLLCLLPFIDKAIHMDDPLFVWSAEWILKHPGDFYGGDVNWYGVTSPMSATNCNPPVTAYLLAGIGSLFGWREIALHGAFILVAFAAVAGIYQLARLWCGRPMLATMIAILTPAFLVSSTMLMSDVLMLAFWVWTVVMWERGLYSSSFRWFLAAGVLAGLAVLTKYSAITFLPLLPVLGLLRKRNFGWWLLWLAIPAIMIEGYQLGTAKLYGQGLISTAVNYAAANPLTFEGGWKVKLMVGLAFTGGCLLPMLFFMPLLWSRRTLIVGTVLTWGLSLGALLFCEKLGAINLSNWDDLPWSFLLQMSLFMAGGLQLFFLSVAEVRRKRDAVTTTLAIWIFGGFLFAIAFNWTINARSLLPIVPAAAILLVRRLEQINPMALELRRWLWPISLSAIFSGWVTAADFDNANSSRTAASQIMTQYKPQDGQLWFQGHWGFQYYMQKLGAKPVDYALTTLQTGDLLVVPANNSNAMPPPSEAVELLDTKKFAAFSWLSTMQHDAGAGFHDAGYGPIPFVLAPISIGKYFIYKILKPFQFHPQTTVWHQGQRTSDWRAIKEEYESLLQANPNDAQTHGQLTCM